MLLHRGHEEPDVPGLEAVASGDTFTLRLPAHYLDARPLLQADLASEPSETGALGVRCQLGGG